MIRLDGTSTYYEISRQELRERFFFNGETSWTACICFRCAEADPLNEQVLWAKYQDDTSRQFMLRLENSTSPMQLQLYRRGAGRVTTGNNYAEGVWYAACAYHLANTREGLFTVNLATWALVDNDPTPHTGGSIGENQGSAELINFTIGARKETAAIIGDHFDGEIAFPVVFNFAFNSTAAREYARNPRRFLQGHRENIIFGYDLGRGGRVENAREKSLVPGTDDAVLKGGPAIRIDEEAPLAWPSNLPAQQVASVYQAAGESVFYPRLFDYMPEGEQATSVVRTERGTSRGIFRGAARGI